MEESFRQPNLLVKRQVLRIWVTVGGVFLLFILAAVLYWDSLSHRDTLIAIAPVDAVAYAHFQQPSWPRPKVDLSTTPLAPWLDWVVAVTGVDKQAIINADSFSVVVASDDVTNQLQTAILLGRTPDQLSVRHSTVINGGVAIGSNQFILTKLEAVAAGSLLPLTNSVPAEAFNDILLKMYFNSGAQATSALSESWPGQIFSRSVSTPVFMTWKIQHGQWHFRVDADQAFGQQPSAVRIAEAIPPDFLFFISSFNIPEFFSGWIDSNDRIRTIVEQFRSSAQTVYDFNWSDMLAPLFAKPVDVVVFAAPDHYLGFDFVMFLPSTNENDLANLEYFTSVLLAQRQPTEVRRTLPDGSMVTELVAAPDVFVWQSEPVDHYTMRYVSRPQLGFELAYAVVDDHSIVASSRAVLHRALIEPAVNLSALAATCQLTSSQNILVINSTTTTFMPTGLLVAQQTAPNRLDGCIVDN